MGQGTNQVVFFITGQGKKSSTLKNHKNILKKSIKGWITYFDTQPEEIPWAANIVNWRCSVAVQASLVLLLSSGEIAAELLQELVWSCRRASTALVNWSILIFRGFSGCREPKQQFILNAFLPKLANSKQFLNKNWRTLLTRGALAIVITTF